MLDNVPGTGADKRFLDEWLIKALVAGKGLKFVLSCRPDNGYAVVVGVDLAVSRGEGAALTSFCAVLVHPDGRRQLLSLEAGRWSGPDIISRVIDHGRRYPGALIMVENNGAQDYLRQFAAEHVPTVIPYTTGRNKADPRFGVESLATEMFNGAWLLPCDSVNSEAPLMMTGHPEVKALCEQCQDYSPDAHTGDRLMSLWFAREGILRGTGEVSSFNLRG